MSQATQYINRIIGNMLNVPTKNHHQPNPQILLPSSPPSSPPFLHAVPNLKVGDNGKSTTTSRAQAKKKAKRNGGKKGGQAVEGSGGYAARACGGSSPQWSPNSGSSHVPALALDSPSSPSCASCSRQSLTLPCCDRAEIGRLLWECIILELLRGNKPVTSVIPKRAGRDEPKHDDLIYGGLKQRYLHGRGGDLHYTTDHAMCQLRACSVKKAAMFDKLIDADYRKVPVRFHVQPELMAGAEVRAFDVELFLHVHQDEYTGSEYVCAQELVRAFFPKFFVSVTKLMHSLYTLNHAYGRGSPYELDDHGIDDPDAVLTRDTWKHWVGCPQALQNRKPSQEHPTRVWLSEGTLEIAFGAECEPDASNIDPVITTRSDTVQPKGKGKA